MAEREPGFYWVKWAFAENEWSIARWWDGKWLPLYQAITQQSPGVTDDGMAEVGERAVRSEPQPITDAQKTGERFLVWYIGERLGPHADESDTMAGWYIARWLDYRWTLDAGPYTEDEPLNLLSEYTTHHLPLPPDVKP